MELRSRNAACSFQLGEGYAEVDRILHVTILFWLFEGAMAAMQRELWHCKKRGGFLAVFHPPPCQLLLGIRNPD